MAQYFEPSTDTDANFINPLVDKLIVFYLRFILEKFLTFSEKHRWLKLLLTPTMPVKYLLGDSVKIIKEPVISVSDY